MTQSATAFGGAINGRENLTNGLWTHRGPLALKGGATLSGDLAVGGTLVVTGNTTLGYATVNANLGVGGTVSANYQLNAYKAVVGPLTTWFNEHQIQILSDAGYQTGIGFHEQGNSATTLYKPIGDQHNLRIHGNDGVDYAVAGAPNSAQMLIGYTRVASGFSLPTTGWYETDVQVTPTWSGAQARIEWEVNVIGAGGVGAVHHIGLGLDGGLTWPSVAGYSSFGTGYAYRLSGVLYHAVPTTGVHRCAIWLYGPAGASLWTGVYSSLAITEQRC